MAEQVKLLGTWASPFSRRVELALKLKGVPYEYVEEDLSNKSDLLLGYNPVHKKVPVLIHNGKPVAESVVILEYIDETWKQNPMLPQDPYERAMARFWANFIDEKVMRLTFEAVRGTQREREEASKQFQEQITFLENELKGKNFFGGQTVGFVDIVAAIIAFWLARGQEAMGIDLISEEKCPEICKWIGRMAEIEVVRECIPPEEKYLVHVKKRIEEIKAAKESANP